MGCGFAIVRQKGFEPSTGMGMSIYVYSVEAMDNAISSFPCLRTKVNPLDIHHGHIGFALKLRGACSDSSPLQSKAPVEGR